MDTNKQESQEGAPIVGNCGKCNKIYNKRTGAYDSKYGMICIECYKSSESHDGVEELVKEFAEIWHNYPAASPTEYNQRQMQLKWLRQKLTSLNTKKHE